MSVEIENDFIVKIDGTQYKAEFAKIDEVHLGFEDHGIYTVHIGWMMGGSSHHGTGHMMFSYRDKETNEQVVNYRTAQLILRLMECLGDWDRIKGKECLALYPVSGGYNSKALGLAPMPGRGGRPVIFSEIFDDNN